MKYSRSILSISLAVIILYSTGLWGRVSSVYSQNEVPPNESKLREIIINSFLEEPLIINIEIEGTFAVGSLLERVSGEVIPGGGLFFLAIWDGETWVVEYEGTDEFRQRILIIPDSMISPSLKDLLVYSTSSDLVPPADNSLMATGYKLPWSCGVTYKVWGAWGTHSGYNAIDVEMPLNSTIVAAHAGTVTKVVQNNTACGCTDATRPLGNYVTISHDGLKDSYWHIAQNGALVSEGQYVSQGQPIARSHQIGKTCSSRNFSCATGTCPYDSSICKPFPHLHFQIQNSAGVYLTTTFDDWGVVTGNTLVTSGNGCDGAPPISSIALSGTAGEASWYKSSVIATITATDNLSGVSYSQFNLDGTGWINYSSPVTVTTNGFHTLQYRSVDKSGNWEDAKSTSIKIDTIPPLNPTSTIPGCTAQNNLWNNTCGNPNFSWSGASDAISGLAYYAYYWGGDLAGTNGVVTSNSLYDPPPVSDGTYYLRVRTQDQAGNWSGWVTLFTLRYDGTRPTGSIILKNGWTSSSQTLVNISLEATDASSGVIQLRLRNAGEAWSDWTAYKESAQWMLPALTGQEYIVEVEYQDVAGNTSLVISDSILLDIYPESPRTQHYSLIKSTFGMGGTNAQSTNLTLTGTLSQVSAIGYSLSENYKLTSGFWSWFAKIEVFLYIYLPVIMK